MVIYSSLRVYTNYRRVFWIVDSYKKSFNLTKICELFSFLSTLTIRLRHPKLQNSLFCFNALQREINCFFPLRINLQLINKYSSLRRFYFIIFFIIPFFFLKNTYYFLLKFFILCSHTFTASV